MKALSLWQPWASAIALGLKRVETRSWSTRHRGPLAIHAAKKWGADERDWARHFARIHGQPELAMPPLGAIVAVAQLVGVRPADELRHILDEREIDLGNYGPGRFGLILEDIRPLATPMAWRGAQTLFEVPDEALHRTL